MITDFCRDCHWWIEQKVKLPSADGLGSRAGQCRRFPPIVILGLTPNGPQPIAYFPTTTALDGCGEFQAAKLIET